MRSLTMNPVNRNKGNQVTSGNSLFPFDNSIVEGKLNKTTTNITLHTIAKSAKKKAQNQA